MAKEVKLRLEVLDVYDKPVQEKVDIVLRHQVLSDFIKASASAANKIEITGLRGAPQGLYRIDVDPPSYQYVSQFINMKASGITSLTVTVPIDPGKVKKVNFPPHSKLQADLVTLLEKSADVLSLVGKKGKELYDAIDDKRKAGLLNIVAKTAATGLSNNRSVLTYIQELKELRGDRFFAVVTKELREETKHSINDGTFHEADQSLHHPPDGFGHAGSFKTPDHYGNLQLTFFVKGDEWVADIDIDDAGGLEHVFQVLRNKLSGEPTNPYNIHEILVGFQKLDPGYTFVI